MLDLTKQKETVEQTIPDSGLVDSGVRTTFDTGAQSEIVEGNGRCDLLPLVEIGKYYKRYYTDRFYGDIFINIGEFRKDGDILHIHTAIGKFIHEAYKDIDPTAIIELSKHYEAGAKKYVERNWEQGIPLHCFVDSGVRHFLKWLREDTDEPHDRAFLWRMFGLLWTYENHPELDDYTIKEN